MSNIKELIRAEIGRLKQHAEESKMEWVNEGYNQNAFAEDCRISSFDKLLSFLDTLPDEPEQPTRGYDEAYLNEKIEKASKSWKGVDVDKFMDEIRGREPVSDCNDLEEEIETYFKGWYMDETDQGYILHTPDDHAGLMSVKQVARHFAEWAASYLRYTTKMMGDELEEIAENIYKVPFGTRAEDFKAGAEWQKKQFEKKES